MKHKHYEMIVAKAANIELTVFYRYKNDEWEEASSEMLVWDIKAEHFLCLPQHKETCLHWLNGGDLIQDSEFVKGKYSDVEASMNPSFSEHGDLFMTESRNIRMKPSKEKRWLLVNVIDNFQPRMFDDEDYANHILQGSHPNWSKHEIEVEV